MIFEPKQFLEQLDFVRSGSCRGNYKKFLFVLRATRIPFLKRSGLFLSLLQNSLLRNIATLQDEATELSRERKNATKNEEIKRIDKLIGTRRQILRVTFTIMDGVVARCFYFNRPFLRVMSENRNPGHLTKIDQDHLALLQSFLWGFRRGITLINDITRYLRIGDITRIVEDRKILIYEAKTDTKTGKTRLIDVNTIFEDMKSSKNFPKPQRMRQIMAQMAIINKRVSVPKKAQSLEETYTEQVGVDIVDLDFKIKTHHKKVKKILNQSKRSILTKELFEEGYFVSILRCDKLTEENLKQSLDEYVSFAPEWVKKDSKYQFRVSNYQTFLRDEGEFPRNTLPYSAFPFSSDYCLKLITGDIYIAISVDLIFLKNKLEAAGWEVEDGNFFDLREQGVTRINRNPNESFSYRDPIVFNLSRDTPYGGYVSSVLSTQILLGMLSFYSFDFFVDVVNTQFANSKPGDGRLVTHNYLDEENIFV